MRIRRGGFISKESALSPVHQSALQNLVSELKTIPLDYYAERYLRDFFQVELSLVSAPLAVFNALKEPYSFESDRRGFTKGLNIFHILAMIQNPIPSRENPHLIPALQSCGLGAQINAQSQDPFNSKTPLMLAIENGHIRYALELLNNGAEPSMTPADVSALAGGSVDTLTVAASTTYKKHTQSQTEKTDKPAAEDIDSVILSVLMEKDDVDSSVSKAVNKLDESQQKPLTTQNSINAPQEKPKSSSAPDDAISEDSKMGLWQSVLAFKGAYGISIIKGTDLKDLSFPGGLTVLGEALRLQKFELASRLFQLGYETLTTRTHATYQIPGKADPVSETELTGLIMNYIQDGSRFQLFKDACSYFAQIPSPYQLYLFLRSGDEITSDYPNERGLSVFQVASNLLYVNQENRPISYFLEHLPKGPALAGHRNQSDFLLLLNQNPEAADSSSAGLQMLESLGISRTPRSGMTRGEAPANQIHWALSRIGSLNYSFARLRFDAMSTILKESDGSEQKLQPSLLSLFGATCISSSEAQQRSVVQRFGSQSYGSQFFFEPGTIEGRYSCFSIDSKSSQEVTRTVDSRTTVSLRQGYYLVSNPNYGTLIIRNSSPEFGRTLMTDSAIYLTATVTRQLSAEDLKFPSQQVLNSGTNPIEIKDLVSVLPTP